MVLSGEVAASELSEVVRNLARSKVAETASALLTAYLDNHPALQGDDYIRTYMAVAARYADNRALAERLCGEFLELDVPQIVIPAAPDGR